MGAAHAALAFMQQQLAGPCTSSTTCISSPLLCEAVQSWSYSSMQPALRTALEVNGRQAQASSTLASTFFDSSPPPWCLCRFIADKFETQLPSTVGEVTLTTIRHCSAHDCLSVGPMHLTVDCADGSPAWTCRLLRCAVRHRAVVCCGALCFMLLQVLTLPSSAW